MCIDVQEVIERKNVNQDITLQTFLVVIRVKMHDDCYLFSQSVIMHLFL